MTNRETISSQFDDLSGEARSQAIEGARASVANWRLLAECQSYDPELFFAPPSRKTKYEYNQRIESAKGVCGACIVATDCLSGALERGEVYGVWGGLSEDELRALSRRAMIN